ncbi:cadherin-like beta sandwich domain-containing protein [Paenibacillus medicaginis]|uniref:Cadherin-like beta sandwich domain-containing protein n=1 Tax=Paenibacillus medicaginis TaxID=1470560 RepID=A0ABV5C3F3_9BACL
MRKKVKQLMACVLIVLLLAAMLPELSGGKAHAASSGAISTAAGNGTSGYSGDGGAATTAQLANPTGVATDSSGNLYIADYANNRVRKVDSSGNISTVAGTGSEGYSGDGRAATTAQLNNPFGVAVDNSGNLYIADFNNNRIRKVDSLGNISTVAGTGSEGYSGDGRAATTAQLAGPTGVAVDNSGNLYIADFMNNRIRKVDSSGNISTVAGTGENGYSGDGGAATTAQLSDPQGVAVDSSGNLYIADRGNNRIRKVDSSGNISTVAGTGEWGYSGDGGAATTAQLYYPFDVAVDSSGNLYIADAINQRIRKVDSLGNISTVAGTGEAGYSGDGGAATTAQLNNPFGVAVDNSGNLYIADFNNNRIRKVGLTSSNVNLSGLTLSSGSLSPAFASDTTSYTASVANSVGSITVTPTVSDSNATVTVNGTEVTSGSASGEISLSVGSSNTITVVVTAQDGTTKQTYTVTVTRASSSKAELSGLTLSSGSLSPVFASDTTSYTASVANSVGSITVTPTVSDSNATVTVNGTEVTSGSASGEISLGVGSSNTITVVVTAQDGTTKQTYTVTVTRMLSSKAELSGLTLSSGSLSPAFASDTTSYTASVANSVGSIMVTPTVSDSNATVTASVYNSSGTYGPISLTSEAAGVSLPLDVGVNTIQVVVTAQDGTTNTYTVTVTRVLSSKAELSGLTLSSGSLSPAFAAGTTSYTASVGNRVSSITVTPTVSYSNATVTEAVYDSAHATVTASVYNSAGTLVMGPIALTSGAASDSLPLSVGINTIKVVVTAQDGTMQTYTVTVTRSSGTGSSSSGSSSTGSPSTNSGGAASNNSTGFSVIVNGKKYDQIATGTTTHEDGKTVLAATVDTAKLMEQLAKEGDKPVIIIPVASVSADKVTVVLTGDAIKAMENRQAVLEVQTANGNYKLPAAEIAIARLSEQLGGQVKLPDIVVHVDIAKSDAAKNKLAESAAEKGKFSIVVPPVDFTVTASYNGKTADVDKFNAYVEREIPLPDGIDPNKITTATVLAADGTVFHVPTFSAVHDGKYYAVVNSLTNSTYTLIWHPMTFADTEGHWSKEAVSDMASRLIVNGVDETHYNPDAAITRAEFAAIIVRALGLADNGKTSAYGDVKSGDWYVGAVAKAQEYGIIEGYEDGTFRPAKTITREEAMVMIARAMKWTGLDTNVNSTDAVSAIAAFADGAAVDAWAKQSVAVAVKSGLVQGRDAGLKPTSDITRAETAAIVQRMLEKAKLIDDRDYK